MSEQGPDELRKRLMDTVVAEMWDGYSIAVVGDFMADAILEAIAASGLVLVDRDRLDRLVSVALKYQALDIGMIGLVPGDLEQSGAGE